mmetsp:Transcript_77148/g.216572  ORF Transcript_77148/g.216572 Transcript_77148/m.216572 type:complete len:272 (-) Transcript_77148:7-822(-)
MSRRTDAWEFGRAWGTAERRRCDRNSDRFVVCADDRCEKRCRLSKIPFRTALRFIAQNIGQAHDGLTRRGHGLPDDFVAKRRCRRGVVIAPRHALILHRCHHVRCWNALIADHGHRNMFIVARRRRPQAMVLHVLACGCRNGGACPCRSRGVCWRLCGNAADVFKASLEAPNLLRRARAHLALFVEWHQRRGARHRAVYEGVLDPEVRIVGAHGILGKLQGLQVDGVRRSTHLVAGRKQGRQALLFGHGEVHCADCDQLMKWQQEKAKRNP